MARLVESTLQRLRLNVPLGAAMLNKIGVVDTPLCQSCSEAEDTAHIPVSSTRFGSSRAASYLREGFGALAHFTSAGVVPEGH